MSKEPGGKPKNGSSAKPKAPTIGNVTSRINRKEKMESGGDPLYFRSLTVRNIRCFGDEPQTLNLATPDGKSWARWTLILGNNGTGKSTLLQLLGSVELGWDQWENNETLKLSFIDRPAKFPRLVVKFDGKWQISPDAVPNDYRCYAHFQFSIEKTNTSISLRSNDLVRVWSAWFASGNINFAVDEILPGEMQLIKTGYGAWRRLGKGSLSTDVMQLQVRSGAHLFDDDIDLVDAEEWLQQLDYSASKKSAISKDLFQRFELVRTTLINLLPDVNNVRITEPTEEHPSPRVLFSTAYGEVQLRQLGFGYQSLISWVVDFAARMFAAYPQSPNPLAEPAVCLVDEIDLHLHPSWQRKVMSYLSERFPKTQFIATAHSPLIVQAAPEIGANVVVLHREGDHVVISNNPIDIKGWRADQILSSELFDEQPLRSPQVQAAVDERVKLLSKPKMTASDKRRVKELDAIVNSLPVGSTKEEREITQQLKDAAALLDRVTSGKR